ncbi:hypothetical protein [Novosphingobium sp.]|uniref:hypothetical protein n=1 Tax=Novosphingobium sp. TaxID=1874826 RepID=UPI001EB67DA1|nr:hypothetical protein [Novosphingobium sp.]MBK9009855.1 hypothetical protein [Novosphingobium sp.]
MATTASNTTEGVPASWPSALSVPPLTLISPTLGATSLTVPPSFSTPALISSIIALSEPSA